MHLDASICVGPRNAPPSPSPPLPSSQGKYIVDQAVMDALPKKSIVMHPLPRLDEIDPAVDSDPRSAYFREVGSAMPYVC